MPADVAEPSVSTSWLLFRPLIVHLESWRPSKSQALHSPAAVRHANWQRISIMFSILGEFELSAIAQMVATFVIAASCLMTGLGGPRIG